MKEYEKINSNYNYSYNHIKNAIKEIDEHGGILPEIEQRINDLETEKQDKLTAGIGITISPENVISAVGGGNVYMHSIYVSFFNQTTFADQELKFICISSDLTPVTTLNFTDKLPWINTRLVNGYVFTGGSGIITNIRYDMETLYLLMGLTAQVIIYFVVSILMIYLLATI